jgi:hypothetical protein
MADVLWLIGSFDKVTFDGKLSPCRHAKVCSSKASLKPFKGYLHDRLFFLCRTTHSDVVRHLPTHASQGVVRHKNHLPCTNTDPNVHNKLGTSLKRSFDFLYVFGRGVATFSATDKESQQIGCQNVDKKGANSFCNSAKNACYLIQSRGNSMLLYVARGGVDWLNFFATLHRYLHIHIDVWPGMYLRFPGMYIGTYICR